MVSCDIIFCMINKEELVAFLIRAKQKTYAGHGAEVESSRPTFYDAGN